MVQRSVVPGGADRLAGRPAPARPGEPRRVPALVRRPRDRPAGALPGDADATRGDRALLRRPGRRPRRAGDGRPREATDRLIGTCAFSQLDGDNGSALYHITIGESDAWGQGYGTEATQLMLDHAFGTLGLHRIALFVFEFNERAIRAYQRCGFVVEGRVARVDLARRPLVGRAGDERARVRLARRAPGSRPRRSAEARRPMRRGARPPTTSRAESRSVVAAGGPARAGSIGRWR